MAYLAAKQELFHRNCEGNPAAFLLAGHVATGLGSGGLAVARY